jgi:hypothetical protein
MRPSPLLTPLVVALGLAVAPGPAPAQTPPLTRLHALLVVDTRSGLGESVEIDGRRMKSALQTGLPPNRLDVTVFDKPAQLTKESILRYYRALKTGPSEAVLCYYAGHGATDPEKGHFLALQELHTEPLTRDELRQAMLQKKPGLVVILSDCCSDRFDLKRKHRDIWDFEHREINPVMRDLFLRHRGVVDITAATGNEAFGDEHQGGLFTRAFGKLLRSRPDDLDTNHDGFVDWREFFPRLQKDTERSFIDWAQQHRALGETVQQKSQRPRAFTLPGDQVSAAPVRSVTIRNDTDRTITYEYRWPGGAWQSASIGPRKAITHSSPPGLAGGAVQLEVRSKDGNGSAKPGSTLYFHD